MKILVISPHPDDEVLGCGGTIKKFSSKGNEISVLYVTSAYEPDWSKEFIKKREKQIEMVSDELGISEKFFLNLPTAKIDQVQTKELVEEISKIRDKVKPNRVFIPFWADAHQDHKKVAEASLISFRSDKSTADLLCYETLSETEWGTEGFKPNFFVDIGSFLENKISSMKIYSSELKKEPHPRSLESIRTLAKKRGSEINVKFAESFVLIRKSE